MTGFGDASLRINITAHDRTRPGYESAKRNTRAMQQEIFKIDNTMARVARRTAARVLLIGGAFAAVAGHAVALTAAVWPLVGALGAIPAVTVGGIAGIASLIVGFRGLGKALQGASAGSSSYAAAEKRVESAQKSVARAQEALNDAREDAARRIDDMNRSLRRTALDERSAILNVRDAQKALREARSGGDRDERERARIAYEQAILDLEEVRVRLQDVTKEERERREAGVEGSDEVRDALERQQEALENLAEAQAALAGGGGSSPAAEAYRKLAPEARAFVDALKALGPAWRPVQQAVQSTLFSKLADDLRLLSGRYLPVMRMHLPAIAQGWNDMFRSIMRTASGNKFVADMNFSLGMMGVMWRRVGAAFGGFLSGFRHWVVIGSAFLPRLGSWVNRAASRFDAWSRSVRETGRGFRWIEDALTTGHKLNELFGAWIVSIGKVIALGQDRTLLDRLIEGSRAFRDWLETAEGQERITKMWERARDVGSSAWRLIKEAVALISVADLTGLGAAMDLLANFVGQVSKAMAILNPMLKVVVPLFVAFKGGAILAKLAIVPFTLTLVALRKAFEVMILPINRFELATLRAGRNGLFVLKSSAGMTAAQLATLNTQLTVAAAKTAAAGAAMAVLSGGMVVFGAQLMSSGGTVEGLALVSLGLIGVWKNIRESVIPALAALRTQLTLARLAMLGLVGAGGALVGAAGLYLFQRDVEAAAAETRQLTTDLQRLGASGEWSGRLAEQFGDVNEQLTILRQYNRQDLLGSFLRGFNRFNNSSLASFLFPLQAWVGRRSPGAQAVQNVQNLDNALVQFAESGGDVNRVLHQQQIRVLMANGQLPLFAQYVRDAAAAQDEELNPAIGTSAAQWDEAAGNLQTYMDLLLAQGNTVFGFVHANDRLTEAQRRYQQVLADPNHTREEAEAALWDVTEAQFALEDATRRAVEVNGPQFRAELAQWLESGRITTEQFNLMTGALDEFFNRAANQEDIEIRYRISRAAGSDRHLELLAQMAASGQPLAIGTQGVLFGGDRGSRGSFGGGGIVPGAPGEAVPITAHGGEGVFTPDQMAALGMRGGAQEVHVYLHTDPDGMIKVVRKEVRKRGGNVQLALGN